MGQDYCLATESAAFEVGDANGDLAKCEQPAARRGGGGVVLTHETGGTPLGEPPAKREI